MKNSKGMTLLEVLVSLALISTFMIILMNILSTLKTEDAFASTKADDAVIRTEIINRIETELLKDNFNKICYTETTLTLSYEEGRYKTITFYSDYAQYEERDKSNVISREIWRLNHGTFSLADGSTEVSNSYHYLRFVMPVKSSSTKNYDIVITYIGNRNIPIGKCE